MANIQILPYAQQIAAIQRQRKLADLLQEQGMQPSATQMVSGIAIPTSPWETASKLAQSLAGAYAQSRSDKEEAEAKKQARDEYKQNIQDFISAIGPQKAYASTPVMEQSSDEDRTEMAPKMQWSDETGQMEPVQDWKETLKPGLSRNQAIARLLEMQGSENPYIAAAAPTLTGLLPKQTDATDLFNKLDASKLTPESLQLVAATGDITKAQFKPEEMTPYQAAELDWKQKDAGVRRLEAAVQNARSQEQLNISKQQLYLAEQARDQSKREFEINYPGASAQGSQAAGRPLDKVSYNAFKEQDAKIDEASGNFTNFRSVLGSISPTQGIAGKQAGELATAFKAAQASIRLLQNTGVLNQGELPFLEETLANPQGFMAIANPTTRAKLEGQLNELDKLVKRKRAALYNQYEQPLPSSLQATSNQGASGEPDLSQYYAGFNQNGT